MDVFRVRLNCIDHYQATPTRYDPRLRNDVRAQDFVKATKVPVIRVFGSTETGQKVCAHIHGAFPYLYIEYTGGLAEEEVGTYMHRLHLSIDHALAVSYRRDVYGSSAPKYVARITLVKGIPFYGFHVGYRFYLKIYMFNPIVMTRLADLLHQGVILKRQFQPFEAHLQFLLQFMTDYNLYGCSYLEAGRTTFRAPVPRHDEDDEDDGSIHLWHSQAIPAENITDDFTLPRVSHCSIEVDICVQDIMNRKAVKERRLHHDFIEKSQLHDFIEKGQPVPDLKLVHSMAGLWKDETERRKRRLDDPDPGSSPFPPEALVSMSADPRHSQPQGWIHEDEYREQIQQLIAWEKSKGDGTAVAFETFALPIPLESAIKTTLEAVEDLYPENLLRALGLDQDTAEEDPTSSIVVDEESILENKQDDGDDLFPNDSEEELLLLAEAEAVKQADQNAIIQKEASAMAPSTERRDTVHGLALEYDQQHKTNSIRGLTAKTGDLPVSRGFAGVCRSGLQTGRRPVVALHHELIEAAKAEGLVSRRPELNEGHGHDGQPIKRPVSPIHDEVHPKRRKIAGPPTESGLESRSSKAMREKDETEGEVRVPKQRFQAPVSSQSKKTSRLDSSKPQGNQRLSFAVVKDPNDPSTMLCLSQQSSSQHSDDPVVKKQVSFDPLLPARASSSATVIAADKPMSLPSLTSSGAGVTTTPTSLNLNSDASSRRLVIGDPPSVTEVVATMDVIYQDAYYSKEKDVPQRMREYAGREFRLQSDTLPFLPDFDAMGQSPQTGRRNDPVWGRAKDELRYERLRRQCTLRSWDIAELPPSFLEVESWWQEKEARAKKAASRASGDSQSQSGSQSQSQSQHVRAAMSQIQGPTPQNKHGFKYSQKLKSTSVQHEAQYMSTMALEIHVNTRGKLVPNPEEDEVQCIFWCAKSDENTPDGSQAPDTAKAGIVVLSEDGLTAQQIQRQSSVSVVGESSELDVMVHMVEIVRSHDPDILTGYEVHGSSWGYLVERARLKYDYNLCDEFSRMKSQSHGRFGKETDRWGFNTTSTIRVTGRHMINVWRAMRGELNLLQYTMENVAWHLLHRRIPHYSHRTLSDWYTSGRYRDLSKVLRYYQTRTKLDLEILEGNELIARTSEQARLLGVDFFSVFSRGSQFKVESIMFRIAKPENFLLVSPSRKQIGGQNALECLPLVMEPQSAFYNSPLLVLDFQSLYPSVMIAYNYCYSTFLGRIVNWRGTNKMGFTEYQRRERLLELLKDDVNIAPNGMMYVKGEIRKSLLAKMLTEILETRVMVKSGMKQDKDDKTLQQLLNNRQLALKLLANVTYGYASASFSGRMPCSEIADSIVQTARETLERSIAYIHSVEQWGAEVVYGDTDSLFISLPGRTREQAFDLGEEMAKAITDMNPRPVKLKFEKVYHPCVLLAKKRYVGYKYESRNQTVPEFDAKGIETVRRDGTPAEQKIEEKALRLLFETADLSQVKSYFQAQCSKIMRGAVSVQDFCFAKEVRLGSYSDKPGVAPPPGALLSTKRMLADARAEPQYGERVPYVVVTGAPGARLVDRCVAPEDLLASGGHAHLDADYYIAKNIVPPLERIFNLVGADVRAWYDELPRVRRLRALDPAAAARGATLESYLRRAACAVCGVRLASPATAGPSAAARPGTGPPVCTRCRRAGAASAAHLAGRVRDEEARLAQVEQLCRSCAALSPLDEVRCDSGDCAVFYTRMKQGARVRTERAAVGPVLEGLRRRLEW